MTPLRVLTISHMFPTRTYQRHGIFICREAELLRAFGIECSFLVGRPWAPWPLRLFARWRDYGPRNPLDAPFGLAARQSYYLRPPGGWYLRHEGRAMARSLLRPAIRWHAENAFDLVLGVEMMADTFAAVKIGKRLGLPVACLAIGTDVMEAPETSPPIKRQIRQCLTEVQLPIGVSQAVCTKLKLLGPTLRDPLCVYLGRDASMFSPAEDKNAAKLEMGWGPDEIVAVYVGAFFTYKGITELVTACRRLFAEYPQFRLVCVGAGPREQELVELKRQTGDGQRVRLCGRLAPADVPPVLRASDFLVLPSHTEGMPQVVLEAMNCGLPVVATRVGGTPEAVQHECTGLLVEPGNAESLGEAMRRMITDEDFRRSAGELGLNRVRDVFDEKVHANRLADALRSLVH